VPSYLLMGGWVLCLGGTPRFSMETIWFDTMDVDFSRPSLFRYDDNDTWVRAHEALYSAAAAFAGSTSIWHTGSLATNLISNSS
jgi:hypothetical protein